MVKALLSDTENLRVKLENKDEDLKELKKQLKLKVKKIFLKLHFYNMLYIKCKKSFIVFRSFDHQCGLWSACFSEIQNAFLAY